MSTALHLAIAGRCSAESRILESPQRQLYKMSPYPLFLQVLAYNIRFRLCFYFSTTQVSPHWLSRLTNWPPMLALTAESTTEERNINGLLPRPPRESSRTNGQVITKLIFSADEYSPIWALWWTGNCIMKQCNIWVCGCFTSNLFSVVNDIRDRNRFYCFMSIEVEFVRDRRWLNGCV